MPALYFNYHIGGTRVSIYNNAGALSTFILNMCAVIGGIYALAHFLYNTLFVLTGSKIGYQELAHWLIYVGHYYILFYSFLLVWV